VPEPSWCDPARDKRCAGGRRARSAIIAGASTTDRSFSIVESTEPPGSGAPLHVHHGEAEGFYILDGTKSLLDSGKIALYGIYFDSDKDSLRPDSQATLQEIAKLLNANPKLNVEVVGHTDNQGKPDYNLDLSRRRAAAVVRELVSKYGIADGRLGSFGCGFYAPVASNDSEDGKAKNRRVELVKW
jgi:outer membrane protein OmpA-like peptidoglycan-associated protein